MQNNSETIINKTLIRLVEFSARRAGIVISLACILSGTSIFYTIRHLDVNTDTADMLSKDLPFRVAYAKYKAAFPEEIDTILILIEADTPEFADKATQLLSNRLQNETIFKDIYQPGGGKFFEENGLLYQDVAELEELVDNLAQAQPLLSKLSQDYSLRGLVSLIGEALDITVESIELSLEPLMNQVKMAIQASLRGEAYTLSWQKLIQGKESGQRITRRFIVAQPQLDFSETLPGKGALLTIRRLSEELSRDLDNHIRIRITGDVALAFEEMESVGRGARIATGASLIAVLVILFLALRSLRMVFVTVTTLIFGLILTLGFATIAVGHLNLISMAFAVLYIGLGVDYAIHFNLCYKDQIQLGLTQSQALRHCACFVGPSLVLCAFSTTIGFFAFVPTAFKGVSELGLISGTGMLLSLVITLTVIPAMFKLLRIDVAGNNSKVKKKDGGRSLIHLPTHYGRSICLVAVPLVVVSIPFLSKASFDNNPLNLRDPNSESVKAIRELIDNSDSSPITLTALASNDKAALLDAYKLSQLDTVEKVVTILDYVPHDQDEKLGLIEELDLIMGPLDIEEDQTVTPLSVEKQTAALRILLAQLNAYSKDNEKENRKDEFNQSINQLTESLRELLNRLESMNSENAQNELISKLQYSLLDSLPIALNSLKSAINAGPVTLDDLPENLVQRWISKNGIHRLEIYPKEKLSNASLSQQFVSEVQKVIPGVTGAPIISLEAGNVVVRAFQQAFIGALIVIALILTAKFRNIFDPVFVILPLVFSGLITVAAMVLLNISFNFANIIALPLLFGLGVDNGIHMVHCVHLTTQEDEAIVDTSTARGILYSGLTTLFSFGTLAFMSHAGMASMGKILTMGVLLSIVSTLLVLPAFLLPFKRKYGRESE